MVVFQFLSNENVTGPMRKGGREGHGREMIPLPAAHPPPGLILSKLCLTDVMLEQSESFVSVSLQFIPLKLCLSERLSVSHYEINLE